MKNLFRKFVKIYKSYIRFTISGIGVVLYLIAASIFFYFEFQYSSKETCIEKYKKFSSWNQSGIIENKFKDPKSHMVSVLALSSDKSIRLDSLLFSEIDRVYTMIKKGDLLVKREGSDTLWLYRRDKKLYYIPKFDCR